MSGLVAGKRALVLGIANKRSIAWGITQSLAREGARLALTYQSERLRENVAELAATLEPQPMLLPCDVTRDGEVEAVMAALEQAWGGLDVLVHSLAFAKSEELGGEYAATSKDGFLLAHEVSSYSLVQVARAARPLLKAAGGGSVITMTYLGSTRVMQNYNIMGVAKASLEASVRYLASDLGPDNIRVNAISAGPIRTLAASAVKGMRDFLTIVEERAPLRRNVTQQEVGDAALFLASDLSRAVTGHVLFVDNGFNIMGA